MKPDDDREERALLAQTEGELLARNSSRRRETDLRWTELEIYRTVFGYRVVVTGRSVIPGEEDRVRVEETPSAEVVVEVCAPTDRATGQQRLTWVSKKTLMEAALSDDDLSEALDDWLEAHE